MGQARWQVLEAPKRACYPNGTAEAGEHDEATSEGMLEYICVIRYHVA